MSEEVIKPKSLSMKNTKKWNDCCLQYASKTTARKERIRVKTWEKNWRKKEKKVVEIIGAVLVTRDNVNPVFISVGHRISLKTAIEFTLKVANSCIM